MMKKNLIIIMIDGGRLDYAQNSNVFEKLKSNSCFLSQSITYAPHTIAAMHATFSGSYGTRTVEEEVTHSVTNKVYVTRSGGPVPFRFGTRGPFNLRGQDTKSHFKVFLGEQKT